MKKSKSNKVKLIESSIKSSLDRIVENSIFRWLIYALFLSVVVWGLLFSITFGIDSAIIYTNTEYLKSDKSLVKVSHINDNAIVFTEDGGEHDKYTNTMVLYGNDYLYSTENNVLVVPLKFSENIQITLKYVSLFLLVSVFSFFAILYCSENKPVWAFFILFVLLILQVVGDIVVSFIISNLYVNANQPIVMMFLILLNIGRFGSYTISFKKIK